VDLPSSRKPSGLALSLKTGQGLDNVIAAIGAKVAEKLDISREAPVLTRARHRHALEHASTSLDRALRAGQSELFAEDLRLAVRAIGRITGRVDVEELLDIVFRDFCIGK
jgi:tRNA modification GTPase